MLKMAVKILLCIFVGIGLFAFSEALLQSKANRSLTWQIDNTFKPKLTQLERDYAELKKDKIQLAADLTETKGALVVLEEESAVIVEALNEKKNALRKLQKSHTQRKRVLAQVAQQYRELRGENTLLKQKITAMFLEIKDMRQTLSSPKMLREKMHSFRSNVKKKSKFSRAPQFDEQGMISLGNGGYLIRNGKSTYPKVRIRVTPVEG